jgi:hypothetical protein
MKEVQEAVPNGAAGAAILAACLGCFALGALAIAGDGSKAVAKMLTFYGPTGPLSGVSTVAILIWLAGWFGWNHAWKGKQIAIGKVSVAAFVLLALGLLLTFPPFEDLLLGK